MEIKSYVMHPVVTHLAAALAGGLLVWAMFVKKDTPPAAAAAAS